MTETKQLQQLIDNFNLNTLKAFLRSKSSLFSPKQERLEQYDDKRFTAFTKVGHYDFPDNRKLIVVTSSTGQELTEKSSKKIQYDKAKKILKELMVYDGGIFIFTDQNGNFRFSLVYEEQFGSRRKFNNFRRHTYFVSKDLPNNTFISRIGKKEFKNLESVKESFSVAAVTDEFYNNFYPIFEPLTNSVVDIDGETLKDKAVASNLALLTVIRIIFIGFIQKRGWIGDNPRFLQEFWEEYKKDYYGKDKFYKRWLNPLFFEALNSPPGARVAYGNNDFSKETEGELASAPFLNGGLFEPKKIDKQAYQISDEALGKFFDFLFSYNFTIEENTVYDEELELNPEFLGIIFERLVNKADGAVYTPRVEVDLMCRLSLVKWLEKNNKTEINKKDLYELFFRELGEGSQSEENQREGEFTDEQVKDILSLIETVTVCDPAVGSGAFPVGMMQVLNEIEEKLRQKISDEETDDFNRKKQIISSSLYGVEVKPWAVWITQLRLWISLFIDAPEELRMSMKPILPNLDFKIRSGDSLVQRIGNKTFPIMGHATLPSSIKSKVTKLKNIKVDFFNNRNKSPWEIQHRELALFREILDSEIREKQERLIELKGIAKQKQVQLFDDGREEEAQQQIEINKKEVERIEQEITELKEQKSSLKEDHPLIWNIEFAEIFAEKGGFDIVIGNPPYVRQEDIADPTGKIVEPKEYKDLLKEMVRSDFPDKFPKEEKIDAKSDLYTYFYIRSLRLLNPDGILTFICSNSWLDVGYGAWLQKFLLKSAPIYSIIDNHAKRSFGVVDVNTTISVIDAPKKKVKNDHVVRFVAFKKPFEKVIFTENLIKIEKTDKIESDDALRVYTISNLDLYESGMEYEEMEGQTTTIEGKEGKYVGEKWGGKFLRAPDIFFTILEKGGVISNTTHNATRERERVKMVPLGTIAKIRRGFTTGANDFFYLEDITDKLN